MKKLKLKPSARDNRRYLFAKSLDRKLVEKAIFDYVGILGMAKSAYMFVEERDGGIVISTRREELNNIVASLAFAKIQISKISGTIKGLGK